MPDDERDLTSLSRLHDIVVPEPVSWWPPAPGWYFLALLVAVALLFAIIAWARRWVRNRYRRQGLAELAQLRQLMNTESDRARALIGLPVLVKRIALAAWPRRQVASLSGDSLLAFLDTTVVGQPFTSGPGKLLPQVSYDSQSGRSLSEQQAGELVDTVATWIKEHNR